MTTRSCLPSALPRREVSSSAQCPTVLYDGSFNGLLCGLNRVFTDGLRPDELVSEQMYQPSFFTEVLSVPTCNVMAVEAWKKMEGLFAKETQRNVVTAFASGDNGKEMVIYRYLEYGITTGTALDRCHSVPAVSDMHDLCQRVRHEAHRLKGLLRFKETTTGVFYGAFKSDHHVICQLADFFKGRLNNQPWVLHDVGRDLMIHWDMSTLHPATQDSESGRPVFTESERRYEELWRTFFRAIAIDERSNPGLQRQFMPRRYWKYLTEML